MKEKMSFTVTHTEYLTVEVEADSYEEGKELALKEAGETPAYDWPESDDYKVIE